MDVSRHHVARHLHNGIAGMPVQGSGHQIRNNAIHDLPWSAIGYGATNTVIELNEFYRTQQAGGDNGTIYAGGLNSNTTVRFNYFHDVPRPTSPWYFSRSGFYIETDAGHTDSTGFNVHGNIFHRYGDGAPPSPNAMGTATLNKGSNNTFRDNLIVRCDDPYAWSTYASAGAFQGNQVWLTKIGAPPNNVAVNPGFLDEGAGNLANRSDGTLVLANGVVIPFNRIGIR